MTKIEFLEMVGTMIDTREIELTEGERKECLNIIDDIKKTIEDYWKNYIINEIQNNCDHPSECEYDCWYHFFGDSDGAECESYMRKLFTEEECEKLWKDSHNIETQKKLKTEDLSQWYPEHI